MSFLAKLYINQQEYTLLDSTFPIYQHMAFDGRPDRLPEGGMLNLQVESTRDRFFVDWMISPSMMAEGRIRYFRRDGISRLFDVEFWDAYCVYYCEDFDHTGPRPLTTRIIISPGVTRYAGSLIEKSWKVTDLEQLEAALLLPTDSSKKSSRSKT